MSGGQQKVFIKRFGDSLGAGLSLRVSLLPVKSQKYPSGTVLVDIAPYEDDNVKQLKDIQIPVFSGGQFSQPCKQLLDKWMSISQAIRNSGYFTSSSSGADEKYLSSGTFYDAFHPTNSETKIQYLITEHGLIDLERQKQQEKFNAAVKNAPPVKVELVEGDEHSSDPDPRLRPHGRLEVKVVPGETPGSDVMSRQVKKSGGILSSVLPRNRLAFQDEPTEVMSQSVNRIADHMRGTLEGNESLKPVIKLSSAEVLAIIGKHLRSWYRDNNKTLDRDVLRKTLKAEKEHIAPDGSGEKRVVKVQRDVLDHLKGLDGIDPQAWNGLETKFKPSLPELLIIHFNAYYRIKISRQAITVDDAEKQMAKAREVIKSNKDSLNADTTILGVSLILGSEDAIEADAVLDVIKRITPDQPKQEIAQAR